MAHKGSVPHYMRATGAAGSMRHSKTLSLNNVDTDKLFEQRTKPQRPRVTQRPRSAITKATNDTSHRDKRRIRSATQRRTDNFVSQTCQLLSLYDGNDYHESIRPAETVQKAVELKLMNLKLEAPSQSKSINDTKRSESLAPNNRIKKQNDRSSSTKKPKENGRISSKSPKTTRVTFPPEALASHISHQIPQCLSGMGLEGSLFLLPGLDSYAHSLPTVPTPVSAADELPYTHVIPDKKPILGPKTYTHPFFERMKKIQGWQCKHVNDEIRIESVQEHATIYSHKISICRDHEEIRDEILELERLMKGLSSDFGTSSVVLYQNEINHLQDQIRSLNLPDVPEEPPTPDPTGLRRFFKEYDTALQALEERRRECIAELRKIEEVENLYERAKLLEANS